MASDDPDFERKVADIIGLTAIQALVLPMSPGRIERHGFEYDWHGTLSLYPRWMYDRKGSGQDCGTAYERGVRCLSESAGEWL
jgi:hypothetical protein